MDNFLMNHHLIDLKGLALLKYKEMGIREDEILILLLLMSLQNTQIKNIDYELLLEYVNFSKKQLDSILVGLVNKKMVRIVGTQLSLEDFYKRLVYDTIQVEKPVEEKKVNLLASFEKEFGRPLTPYEIESLKTWKQMGYQDDFILSALKEATLNGVHNFRYIEKILINWTKDGVKKTGKEKIEAPQDDEEFIEYKWWEEND